MSYNNDYLNLTNTSDIETTNIKNYNNITTKTINGYNLDDKFNYFQNQLTVLNNSSNSTNTTLNIGTVTTLPYNQNSYANLSYTYDISNNKNIILNL